MRLLVAAVGRLKRGPAADLAAEYLRRIAWPVTVREVEERRPLPVEARRRREGELLLAQLDPGACMVALDERGEAPTSVAFADMLGRWRDGGAPQIAFLIGGADGLDEVVRARADHLLALGPMTWPHQLARVLLLEQIYRAQQILAGHPYHRA